jgi:hypothetical protein
MMLVDAAAGAVKEQGKDEQHESHDEYDCRSANGGAGNSPNPRMPASTRSPEDDDKARHVGRLKYLIHSSRSQRPVREAVPTRGPIGVRGETRNFFMFV